MAVWQFFEAKYAKTLDALPDACDTAIQQINDRMYAADFRDDYDDILCYGIAFFKKRCMVRKNNYLLGECLRMLSLYFCRAVRVDCPAS